VAAETSGEDATRDEDVTLREREKEAIFAAMREAIENYDSDAATAAA
jgi:hypothetical protein